MNKQLLETLDCELIVGIVNAVGTKFKEVIQKLQTQLELADYAVETIKVSQDVIQAIIDIPSHYYQMLSAKAFVGPCAGVLKIRYCIVNGK